MAADASSTQVWAPRASTSDDGVFCLPRPDDPGELCMIRRSGFATRVLTIAEIDATRDRIQLEQGRVVLLEIVDRDGAALDGPWETGWHDYVQPSVLIGHDVWCGESKGFEPLDDGRLQSPPWFCFSELPSDVVRFRFSHHGPKEDLLHDTGNRIAHWVSPYTINELQIGK